jgi:hypothetical protein
LENLANLKGRREKHTNENFAVVQQLKIKAINEERNYRKGYKKRTREKIKI